MKCPLTLASSKISPSVWRKLSQVVAQYIWRPIYTVWACYCRRGPNPRPFPVHVGAVSCLTNKLSVTPRIRARENAVRMYVKNRQRDELWVWTPNAWSNGPCQLHQGEMKDSSYGSGVLGQPMQAVRDFSREAMSLSQQAQAAQSAQNAATQAIQAAAQAVQVAQTAQANVFQTQGFTSLGTQNAQQTWQQPLQAYPMHQQFSNSCFSMASFSTIEGERF